MSAIESFAAPPRTAPPRALLRSIVLPREHGGWAFALEPVLLGLVAAPSWPGAGLALAAAALFLSRRPQQIAAKRDARFVPAAFALLVLGGLAILGIGSALSHAGPDSALPLVAALPAGVLFLYYDRSRAARETGAEIAGASFFAAFPAAMVVAATNDWPLAGTLAGFSLIRAISSILSIRVFLRRRKRQSVHPRATGFLVVGMCAVFAMVAWQQSSPVPALWAVVFAAVAGWLLSPLAPPWPAQRVGIFHLVLGAIAMISTGASLR